MSSDESENDEDYVPSDKEDSLISNSEDDESDQEYNGDGPSSKRRKKDSSRSKIQDSVDEDKKPDKTEDELWNEFLGSGTNTKPAFASTAKDPRADDPKSASALSSAMADDGVSESSNTSSGVATYAHDQTPKNEDSLVANEPLPAVIPKAENQAQSVGPKMSKSGVGSLLERISKDKKVTTLEKSRQDWEGFKNQRGITEELSTHNRGKGGFLERKEFLERSDYRQFEKERDMRMSKKRPN